MLRFGETKVQKEKFYAAEKPIKIWDVNVVYIVISKLVKKKTNSKYLIIRPLVLILRDLKLKIEIKIKIN